MVKKREKKDPAKHGALKGVLGMSQHVVSCIQTVVVCVLRVGGEVMLNSGVLRLFSSSQNPILIKAE